MIRIVLPEKEIVMDRVHFMEMLAGHGVYLHDLRRAIECDEDTRFAKIATNVCCRECENCQKCDDCEDCAWCVNCTSCDWCESCTDCVDCTSCENCTGLKGCHNWVDNTPTN